ncbi:hypothetical protein [Devosia sp. 63-57]|uniref:hypothetical protein n=1 Tax=Devosia sp. 63-57 TaxID=1895751 RepID=UPI00257B46B6|nr:hypothetical protein [Devosia sp. 63-57]
MHWREHWKAIAIFAAFTWLIAYIVVWVHRSSCDSLQQAACAARALMTAGADVVTFQWVWDNQTLAAGMFTSGAAGIALVVLFIQRQWQIDSEKKAKYAEALNALNWTKILLRSIADTAGRKERQATIGEIDKLDDHLVALATVSPMLAETVRDMIQRLKAYAKNREDSFALPSLDDDFGFEVDGLEWAFVMATCFTAFFREPERLLDSDANFIFKRQKFAAVAGDLTNYPNLAFWEWRHVRDFFEI